MSVQTTIPFSIRKKCSFYGVKENTPKQDFTNATLKGVPSVRYTPTVKKLMTLSSSESETDSDIENSTLEENSRSVKKMIVGTPRRTRKASNSDDEHGSTPPKLKKEEKDSAPVTPSTLFNRLNLLASPESSERKAPKRLFSSDKYRSARKALHSSTPESLPGRESELAQLRKFIDEHLKNETSGSLYISGPPGTGKTACLSKTMLLPEFKTAIKTIYVNCTAMKTAATIYGKIIQELGFPALKSGKNSKAVIEKYLASNHKMLLLVLDEIDQLDSKKQSVLYSIFEWPSKPNSKLILIGIANALDLTYRTLPRLHGRCELKPKLMNFTPYSKQDIINIISERLKEAGVADVFTSTAMQLLAAKVAAVSGDIRRALDVSRRVVELAEDHKMIQVLQPTNDNESNTGSPKKQQPPLMEASVGLKEVMTVLNGVYGGSQNVDTVESTFPLQQKLLLCSLMLILNKSHCKDVTVGKLHEVYKKVCQKRNIHTVDISEFVSLCSLIETRGVLRLIKKKDARLYKIQLQWDQDEMEAALQNKVMMAEIINDVSCL
ncbi:cell division control protein 6 homolog [Orussus abietinus]|uniref:cell division control protein 6 homolog n=1 Tax=Orussus abietinus TaxID=222816 RepID=UPI0006261E24|nr:cell division control protein 6 homolog [Orussus abietinus]